MKKLDKCPWCGYEPSKTYFFTEHDLFKCCNCNNKIEVVKENKNLKFIKSVNVYGD